MNKLKQLEKNYSIIKCGEQSKIIDFYRRRSNVIGKQVVVSLDDTSGNTVTGKAVKIGENLELYLEGLEAPVTRGRLAFMPSI